MSKQKTSRITYQAGIGLQRQITSYARLSMQYLHSRGVHLHRSVNINASIDGAYPYGDSSCG